ncbi:hypothetical protein [Acidithiobacillus thiooxidans]|uniref:hypothetical protein n=1 Tax=Acidithiobacillus thiooxidans TaxID=930 RepID=UPI001C07BC91|nr:hypothetical protein [Acidithiobacillus thiooxidans]MBU2842837.1 hypothetical protein [Acidithiobacillus thiooxidans]
MFAALPQFKDMKNPHAQIHQIASQIQAALATGQQDEAIRQGEVLSLARDNILQKLGALREAAVKQGAVVS